MTSQLPIFNSENADLPHDGMATESFVGHQVDTPFSAQLVAARETRHLTLESCAQDLRLPVRILRKLEQGDYDGIDHHVYLGSYLSKYARHLGVDEARLKAELAAIKRVEPPLVSTGGIPRTRYLFDRYKTAATYAVLTVVIVVPVIWLGMRGTLDRDASHLSPLDAAPVAQQEVNDTVGAAQTKLASSTPAVQQPAASAAASAPEPHAEQQGTQPLVASMIPNLDSNVVQPSASSTQATDAIGSGAHALELNLANPSWVEVTDKSGTRLEYGLLQPGNKVFRSDQPLDVRIGNAGDAEVTLDGQPVALDAYRHSNVAHFHVVLASGKASVSSTP